MRTVFASILATMFVLDATAAAAAGSLQKSLMKLEPEERAHQACVIKGLEAVRRDKRLKAADRLMPDTFRRARFEGNMVSAKGAAVRAKEHWYALSFECTVSDDQTRALAFSYKLGDEIPPEEWENAGLWK
ncbi:DUF930 domain-containing protein [Hyphomicrobium sp. CS1GBMeth3]|uniref:DUF930 domain-containing protein n=1 Tax=Hyphomicrobium sp. CS1GBMeth3 TaxID=1892845 RepID=UPI000ADD5A78|nr:DUF930 domain-containing protein [Hyphomicrobium sp. CS1GBMeth3]